MAGAFSTLSDTYVSGILGTLALRGFDMYEAESLG